MHYDAKDIIKILKLIFTRWHLSPSDLHLLKQTLLISSKENVKLFS